LLLQLRAAAAAEEGCCSQGGLLLQTHQWTKCNDTAVITAHRKVKVLFSEVKETQDVKHAALMEQKVTDGLCLCYIWSEIKFQFKQQDMTTSPTKKGKNKVLLRGPLAIGGQRGGVPAPLVLLHVKIITFSRLHKHFLISGTLLSKDFFL